MVLLQLNNEKTNNLIKNDHRTDEWIKKMWHIYTMEYYSAIKRIFAICNNMDGPRGYYA